ncbi:PREDICTED: proline-rich receptor-like protein kinase PERK12 isoform X3 [Erythranthe guttata]|uniref:proline-rich receptor-like protein kinase PERK12 isoform X3 n=1 Tax=Erythranthe guttata TaxID=4155 RepID=UPI00064DE495|nr:PREDICTED: proline-rich receptor-like protein kinase PERK12 isoform X3 [Erythranthe guttata]|eukprot:XP_012830379.1 PREDICTED: proline-rich receptor-like protein kinase PERK12 isoform X3 [Erythranthe guttata]
MPEENNQQIVATEEEEEDDDDDDGPPPGFQCIITPPPPPPPPQPETTEAAADDEEDDDGPPPGFHSIAPKPPSPLPSSDMERDIKQEDIEDDDDDDDGPPPGWEFSTLVNALPPPKTTDIETDSKPKFTKNDDEVSPLMSQCTPMQGHSSPATTPPLNQLPSAELPCDTGNKEDDKKIRDKRPTSALQQLPPTPYPLTPALKQSISGKAQLVCGTCRNLCLYQRGAKWVQCPGCQEVNFVLEAHEVGQVKCGGCEVLLMYPHGAPAVQCSSCRFVTEIGAQNRRPPLSVQQDQVRAQARRRRRFNRVR